MHTDTTYRFAGVVLTKDAKGWFFDGPADCGPRDVRTSGRGPYWSGRVSPQFASILLSKARKAGLLPAALTACLLFHGLTASAAPAAPKTPRAKPISSITVRVQPAARLEGKLYRITTVDQDSCVAWVSTEAPNLEQAELAAFRACRQAVNREVDAAAERAGV